MARYTSPDKTTSRIREQLDQLLEQKKELEIKIDVLQSILGSAAPEKPPGFELVPTVRAILSQKSGEWHHMDDIVANITAKYPNYKPDRKVVQATLIYQIKKPNSDIKRDETRRGWYMVEKK